MTLPRCVDRFDLIRRSSANEEKVLRWIAIFVNKMSTMCPNFVAPAGHP
jgi:hypothetical protein